MVSRQPATGASPYDHSMAERLFANIERRFEAELRASGLGRRYQEWRSEHPPLAPFEGLDDLLGFFRDQSIPYRPKDEIAGILCALSLDDEFAELLLLKLYVPGLIARRRRLFGYGMRRDELDAALVAGFRDRAAKTHLGTEMLSGRLLAAARDRARREIAERGKLLAAEPPTAEAGVFEDAGEVTDVAEEVGSKAAAADLIRKALTEGVIRKEQAEILWATSVEDLSVKQAAARFGINEEAARVRLFRARAGLRPWLRERPPSQT